MRLSLDNLPASQNQWQAANRARLPANNPYERPVVDTPTSPTTATSPTTIAIHRASGTARLTARVALAPATRRSTRARGRGDGRHDTGRDAETLRGRGATVG